MLDIIYNSCKDLGSVFGFGAFEGFIIYSGIVVYGCLKASNKKNNKVIIAKGK
ncbi:hypothetical protein QTI60_05620 [Clostridium perfringens]|nr:hypothetical protein [Clostridium perfringens]MDU1112481.1 hypothetical protein [Clostridium perfringens]MDU1597343.1 hypothetical protein [Clostridium perfringens]DAL12903.1 MAG TPA_asm: hypothetical protein [Caudoviricetes sp.]